MLFEVATLPADPLAGTRYRAVRRLGGGGFSDVYEARGPGHSLFAVKVLPAAHRDSQEMASRFLQEGRLLASLRHPNLVPLRELGMTRDGPKTSAASTTRRIHSSRATKLAFPGESSEKSRGSHTS